MVVTLDTELPTEEELTVPELKLSGPALRAGAFHLGKYCQDTFNVRINISNPFSQIFLNENGVHFYYDDSIKIQWNLFD